MTQPGEVIYHSHTMVESELVNETNRGRARLRCPPEQAAVSSLSMNTYANLRLIDYGSTGAQTRHRGVVVSGWSA